MEICHTRIIFFKSVNYVIVKDKLSINIFNILVFFVSPSGVDICVKREITASSGRITSPWHPDKYPANTKCTVTIRQPLDTKITFTFAKMDIERIGK